MSKGLGHIDKHLRFLHVTLQYQNYVRKYWNKRELTFYIPMYKVKKLHNRMQSSSKKLSYLIVHGFKQILSLIVYKGEKNLFDWKTMNLCIGGTITTVIRPFHQQKPWCTSWGSIRNVKIDPLNSLISWCFCTCFS